MLRRILLGAGVLGGSIWAFKKYTYYDSETRASLKEALLAEKRGELKDSERLFHQALHSSTTKNGSTSVNSGR